MAIEKNYYAHKTSALYAISISPDKLSILCKELYTTPYAVVLGFKGMYVSTQMSSIHIHSDPTLTYDEYICNEGLASEFSKTVKAEFKLKLKELLQ